MAKENDRKALGKGLSALLPGKGQGRTSEPVAPNGGVHRIPVNRIDPNPHQPRGVFQVERLRELADSIQSNGVIQPVIVQQRGSRYELVAGERRWRAAQMAGLTEVPAVIQQYASERLLEVALIENIQREDLNPLEVAQAFQRLSTEHGLTHDDIAQRTGKDRSSVTNLLRLLKLPQEIQLLVAEHRLNMGHARALVGLNDLQQQIATANKAAAEGMSVRQVERLVQELANPRTSRPRQNVEQRAEDPNVVAATQELETALGTRVRVVAQSPQRGRIEIEYFSADELDRIYNLIVGGH